MWPPQAHRCTHHLHAFPLRREYTTSPLTQPLAPTSSMVKHDPNLKTPHRLTSYNSEHRPGTVPTDLLAQGRAVLASLGPAVGPASSWRSHHCPAARAGGGSVPHSPPPRWPNLPTVHHQSGRLSTCTPARRDIFSTVAHMTCDIHMSHLLTPWHLQA